jgi:hypothetical protein
MDSNGPNNYLFERFPTQIIAFVVIEFSYLRFSCHFRPRPESATFLLATMVDGGHAHSFCSCLADGEIETTSTTMHVDVVEKVD